MIVNRQAQQEFEVVNKDALSEIRKLDYEVKTGELNLAELRQALVDTQRRIDDAQQRRTTLVDSTKATANRARRAVGADARVARAPESAQVRRRVA